MQPLHFANKYFGTDPGVMQAQRPYRLYIPQSHDRNEFG